MQRHRALGDRLDGIRKEDTTVKDGRKLCPFKKEITQNYGRDRNRNLKHTAKERLGYCVGSRCMAYQRGRCLRLGEKPERR